MNSIFHFLTEYQLLQNVRGQDERKLPVAWLAGNTGWNYFNSKDDSFLIIIHISGEHATSLDALWALRDFMLQEALGVVKIM